MAIRLTLECGHASILRERHTSDGFTHDWEVFVRGVDNADIHHYIEKVVFQLHETFTKPKRVLKEPPYVVKESGYAGFLIPIHVYLKNKDEPKRFQILYKLHLQQRGRVINKVIRHIEIINNPSEEFRRKLLKGGGVVLSSTESTSDRGGEIKTPVMVGKPKLPVGEPKKHRLVESKTSNSFAELFGPPIKTAKISPESKKTTQPEKSTTVKPLGVTEKSDKVDKITKSKDSPHKDTKKEKTEERKDKKVKDASKEKSRSKEKSKRPSSPGSKVYSSPTSKRPSSPPPVKKPRSPSPPSSIKRPLSPKSKEKDIKRPAQDKEREKEREKEKEKEKEKDKDRDKDKSRDSSKSSLDINKTEKKKDKKKHKEDRDKEKKEKYKEGERSSIKETQKINDKKFEKVERSEKEKGQDYKSVKDGRKSPKPLKEGDKVKDEKLPKVEKFDKGEKSEKVKENKSDKDRQKHKHKKKDKKEKRDSSREREKKEKREKSKSSAEKQNNVPPATNPLSMLLQDMRERDSSDSAPSVDEESFVETKPVLNVKKELDDVAPLTLPMEATRPPSPPPLTEIKKEKSDRSKREKPKGSRGEERESRKRKRRSESKGDEENNIKREKDRSHSASPLLEPVSSSQSPVAVDVDSIHNAKDKEDRNNSEQVIKKEGETEAEQVAPDSTNCPLAESDIGEPPVFSEDYVSQLKDLQHKIMTLQDNQELQRVVRVIEETGQYEITKKTFDFDLCALDRRTVQRLQQFFTAS